MLKGKIKKNFEEHKEAYIAVGVSVIFVAVGFRLGRKWQRGVIAHQLKDVVALRKVVEHPMFPPTMSIPEIKEALSLIEGAEFYDALVATVGRTTRIITR